MNEFAFIERLRARVAQSRNKTTDLILGIGDDAAILREQTGRELLITTDLLVEDIDFKLAYIPPAWLGHKALAVSLSDIAAMGGTPRHALITLAVSPERTVADARALYAGLRKAARKFGVSIVGGETSRSPGPLFINVALTGEVERVRCTLRSGGRAGDALYVTGHLGGSRAGKHLDFTPRLAEARWLVAHFKVRAMMDLSDGLAADLPRLAAASRCGYELRRDAVPRTPGCTIEQALTDGEDYELLFAIHPRDTARLESAWKKNFPRLRLTRVGAFNLKSEIRDLKSHGAFDHFA